MTKYSYTIELDDIERIVVEKALRNLIASYQSELESGRGTVLNPKAEYAAEILNRLHDNARKISGNYYDEDGNYTIWLEGLTPPGDTNQS